MMVYKMENQTVAMLVMFSVAQKAAMMVVLMAGTMDVKMAVKMVEMDGMMVVMLA